MDNRFFIQQKFRGELENTGLFKKLYKNFLYHKLFLSKRDKNEEYT